MKFTQYDSREALIASVAGRIAQELESSLLNHETASLAVPGGTTPGPIFDVLNQTDIVEWSRVHIMLTDERWVPEGHERSNTTLVKNRLLTSAAKGATFLPFVQPGAPEDSLASTCEAIKAHLPISVLVLGMGNDMHTASLFPGAPGLEAALAPDAPVLNVLRPASEPDIRVSLSGHVLAGAVSKHLVIFGAEKRAALEAAQSKDVIEAPIQVVMRDLTVHWAE